MRPGHQKNKRKPCVASLGSHTNTLSPVHATLIALLLAAFVFVVFSHALSFPFINYDDEDYITTNKNILRGFSWNVIRWAFTSTYSGDWHPLVWLSFLIDRHFFGLNPAAFHFTNILWHSLNAAFVFLAFSKMTRRPWPSLCLALVFAVHPLRVESVVWISERKDVLSGFFWWATIWFYARACLENRPAMRIAALGAFFFGILSKPVMVTLPLVLLLLDHWPLERFKKGESFWSLVVEKIPFFILSLFSAGMAIFAITRIGSILSFKEAPFLLRCSNAVVSYIAYIRKLFLPLNPSIFYPFPHPEARSLAIIFFYLGFLAFVTTVAWRKRKEAGFFWTGWIWYLVTLLPMIGLFRVSNQAMADRYVYLPHTGLGILVIWALAAYLPKKVPRAVIAGAFGLLAAGWGGLIQYQMEAWRSPRLLNEQAIKSVPDNFIAHSNLGYFYLKNNEMDKAIEEFQKSLAIQPSVLAYVSLGILKTRQYQLDEAEYFFKKALEINPVSIEALHNLGALYLLKNDNEKAESLFVLAARHHRGNWNRQKNFLADFLLQRGKDAEAEPIIQYVYREHPNDGIPNYLMGRMLELRGDKEAALPYYRKASTAVFPSLKAVNRLTLLLMARGEFVEIEQILRKALKVRPDQMQFYINLANVLLAQGKKDTAAEVLEKALALKPSYEPAMVLLEEIRDMKEAAEGQAQTASSMGIGMDVSSIEDLKLLLSFAKPTTRAQ